MFDRITAFARAHHSWVVAGGLAGLAVYDLSRGDGSAALKALVTAAGILGLRFLPAPASEDKD